MLLLSNLESRNISSYNTEAFCDAKTWEELIRTFLSKLKIFSFVYYWHRFSISLNAIEILNRVRTDF